MKLQGNELQIQGLVACIDRDNIDTDQIIPTEYLKSIKKFGFEDYLFDGWRYLDDGRLGITKEQRQINTDFILNNAPYDQASILLTRDNFGCGSSREHAVWALRDFGIKTVIASSFGDIFYNNCFKNGLLPIKLSEEIITKLFDIAEQRKEIEIDLLNQVIVCEGSEFCRFEIDPFRKECILEGLDEIGLSLKFSEDIKNFEIQRSHDAPWVFNKNNEG